MNTSTRYVDGTTALLDADGCKWDITGQVRGRETTLFLRRGVDGETRTALVQARADGRIDWTTFERTGDAR